MATIKNPHATLIKTLERRADGHKAVALTYDKQIDDAFVEINALSDEQGKHYHEENVLREQIASLQTLVV